MVDEKELPQQEEPKTPSEPEPEEKEIVEIPADLDAFGKAIQKVRSAIAKAVEALGTSITYGATLEELKGLERALGEVERKVRQLNDLETVLASRKFTTKDSVDAKIRKIVIEELARNFRFERIGEAQTKAAIVDEDVEVLPAPKLAPRKVVPDAEKVPARDLRAVREEAKSDAMTELRRQGVDVSMYERAASAHYGEIEGTGELPDLSNIPDLEGMTPEELQQAFPDMDPSMIKRVEELKRLAPKKMRGNKLGGISRRES